MHDAESGARPGVQDAELIPDDRPGVTFPESGSAKRGVLPPDVVESLLGV